MKYNLELTEEQLILIHNSLDLYSRVHLGQFEEVAKVATMYDINMLGDSNTKCKNSIPEHHAFEDLIRNSKVKLGFHRDGSYGIFSPEVHEDARNSYDILQVIRHYLANKNYKEGDSRMGVSFDEPMHSGEYPLPTIGG